MFRGLGKALNSEFITEFLEETFKDRGLQTASCVIEDVKFDPTRNCTILYQTKFFDPFFHHEWFQKFYGILLKDEDPVPDIGSPRLYNDDARILLIPFPHDLVMNWLPQIVDRKWMRRKLKVEKVKMKLLAYTPQMRATFHFSVTTKEGENKDWIGKTNAFKKAHKIHPHAELMWNARHDRIGMAKPIAFFKRPRITFQEKIKGEPLVQFIHEPHFPDLLKETARSIALFHQTDIPLVTKRGFDQEQRNLERWGSLLGTICPHLKDAVQDLKERILTEFSQRITLKGPIHADFHHTNIFAHEGKVSLIDLDEMCLGDPALDVGRFLSSMRIPSRKAFGNFDASAPLREHFLESYLQVNPLHVPDIRLYEAASLFVSATSAFRVQREGWQREAESLFQEAQKVFKAAVSCASVARSKTYPA